MVAKLAEFEELYRNRPIQQNGGGMLSVPMFLAWFVLQRLQPMAIIESGVWLGQGTWFFERACPDAKIYCIDVNLKRIRYRSCRAEYFDNDFSAIDWSHLPKGQTLLFFDDHQNAYERMKIASWFGFKHLMFEDNYPVSRGDCYSLKQAFSGAGSAFQANRGLALPKTVQVVASKLLGASLQNPVSVAPNLVDAAYLNRNLEIYQELPPVFQRENTRWGDPWSKEDYPTPEPLLERVTTPHQQLFYDEATAYTWMCYAKLN